MALVPCASYDRDVVARSVAEAINLVGGIRQFITGPGQKVLVKPNLCLPEPPEKGLTTHPEVVRQIVRLCQDVGANVTVGDNPVGKPNDSRLELVWERSGMARIMDDLRCQRSRLDRDLIMFFSEIRGKPHRYFISKEILSMDLVINAPKFKTHSLMTLTGAVKNVYGLLPGNSKRKLHGELPEREDFATFLVDIYSLVSPRLHIVDAVIGIQGEGPGIKGERRNVGLILASQDGVALDAILTRLMNVEPESVHTTRIAGQRGLGESNLDRIKIVGESLQPYIMTDFKLPRTFRYHNDLIRKAFGLGRSYVEVDRDRCRGCALCMDSCPVSAIALSEMIAAIDTTACIECFTCQEICPSGAIRFVRAPFYEQLSRLRVREIDGK